MRAEVSSFAHRGRVASTRIRRYNQYYADVTLWTLLGCANARPDGHSVHPPVGALKTHNLLPVNEPPPPVPEEDTSLHAPPVIPDLPEVLRTPRPALPKSAPPAPTALVPESNTGAATPDLPRAESFKNVDVFRTLPRRAPPSLPAVAAPVISAASAPVSETAAAADATTTTTTPTAAVDATTTRATASTTVDAPEARTVTPVAASLVTAAHVDVVWLAAEGLVTRDFERRADDAAPLDTPPSAAAAADGNGDDGSDTDPGDVAADHASTSAIASPPPLSVSAPVLPVSPPDTPRTAESKRRGVPPTPILPFAEVVKRANLAPNTSDTASLTVRVRDCACVCRRDLAAGAAEVAARS
jgi:hypothetical protein